MRRMSGIVFDAENRARRRERHRRVERATTSPVNSELEWKNGSGA